MSYFSHKDGELLASGAVSELYDRLERLHKKLADQLKGRDYELYPYTDTDGAFIHTSSVSTMKSGGMLTIQYMRSSQQAINVERLMGRDEVLTSGDFVPLHHPVIELRLTPEHFAIELVMSPDAWWDQQNLAGKLSIARHRREFFQILHPLEEARLGYWQGTHLDDMHVEGSRFQFTRVLTEWMSTFAPGKDWFRVGMWYSLEHFAFTEETIHEEVSKQISMLNTVYHALLWRSDNNFRDFYKARS